MKLLVTGICLHGQDENVHVTMLQHLKKVAQTDAFVKKVKNRFKYYIFKE